MIEYICAHCQHRLNLPDDWAGEQSTCTRCGIPFEVPGGRSTASNENLWANLHGAQVQANDYPGRVARPAGHTEPSGDPAASQEMPDWVAEYESVNREKLGPFFWALAYFMPPVALVWALTLPSGHPQKRFAVALPMIWFGLISSVGVFALVVAPAIGEPLQERQTVVETPPDALAQLQAQTPARKQGKSIYPFLDVTRLEIGKVYRVTKPTPFYPSRQSVEDGLANIRLRQTLPAGGMFRIIDTFYIGANPWYQVAISDGKNNYSMWIHYRDLVGRDVHVVPEPTFGNPVIPPLHDPVN